MPSRNAIANYWAESPPFNFGLAGLHIGIHEDELGPDECWACGDILYLERCHILSVEHGGSNDCSNLTILCNACHVESEHLKPTIFETWLRNKRSNEWMWPWMHSRKRLRKLGYADEELMSLLDTSTPEQAAQFLFNKIYGAE